MQNLAGGGGGGADKKCYGRCEMAKFLKASNH